MNNNSFRIKSFTAFFVIMLAFSSFVSAQTIENKIEVKKLPATRYIRSRDFDTKHIALDLKFDWSNSQTSGVERFTFAPLKNDFKQLVLDAGAMVFNSVKLDDPRGQEALDLLKEKFKDNKRFMPFVLQLEEQFKKSLEKK